MCLCMCLLLPTMMGSLSQSFIKLPKSLCSPFLIVGGYTDTFRVFCFGELWNAPVLIQIHNSALYFCLCLLKSLKGSYVSYMFESNFSEH